MTWLGTENISRLNSTDERTGGSPCGVAAGMAASIKWLPLDLPFPFYRPRTQKPCKYESQIQKSKNRSTLEAETFGHKDAGALPFRLYYKVYMDNEIWINSALRFESDPQSLRNTCVYSQVWNMCGPKNFRERTLSTVPLKRIAVTNTKIDKITNNLPLISI